MAVNCTARLKTPVIRNFNFCVPWEECVLYKFRWIDCSNVYKTLFYSHVKTGPWLAASVRSSALLSWHVSPIDLAKTNLNPAKIYISWNLEKTMFCTYNYEDSKWARCMNAFAKAMHFINTRLLPVRSHLSATIRSCRTAPIRRRERRRPSWVHLVGPVEHCRQSLLK